MSIFADGTISSISFTVKNITVPNRILHVFGRKIYPGQSLDLMQIPGIAEEDIRASLVKGDLKNKIVGNHLEIVTSTVVLTENFGNNILDALGTSSLISPGFTTPGITKDLTNNVAVSLFQIDLDQTITHHHTISDRSFSCKLFFAIECTDGYDVQIREGDVNAAAVTNGFTINTAQAVNATSAMTSGTLVATFSWVTSGNIVTLRVTGASSLTPSDFKIHYFLLHSTHRAPAFSFV